MRYMFDSTNYTDDPLTADLVGFYIDGIYATSASAVRARFPHAVLVGISAVGADSGIAGDVEPGCMTLAQGIAWVQRRRAAGFDPTIYINELNGWAGGIAGFRAAGVAQPHWWVADYDNVRVVPAGAVAKQYANPPLTGGHFDASVVLDFWPGVDSGGTEVLDPTDPIVKELRAGLGTLGSYVTKLQVESVQTQNLLEHGIDSAPGYAGGVKIATNDEILAAVKSLPGSGGNADVLAAIADLKAHPDPMVVAAVAVLAKHLGVGTP